MLILYKQVFSIRVHFANNKPPRPSKKKETKVSAHTWRGEEDEWPRRGFGSKTVSSRRFSKNGKNVKMTSFGKFFWQSFFCHSKNPSFYLHFYLFHISHLTSSFKSGIQIPRWLFDWSQENVDVMGSSGMTLRPDEACERHSYGIAIHYFSSNQEMVVNWLDLFVFLLALQTMSRKSAVPMST